MALSCLALFTRCDCEDDLSQLVPEIVVSPSSVDLGPHIIGVDNLHEKAMFIGNSGSAPLVIDSWTLVPDDGFFTIVDPPSTVAMSDSIAVNMLFNPAERVEYGTVVQIRSNDPTRPLVEIPVIGSGGPPLIEVVPEMLDFGLVNQGPGLEQLVTVTNIGHDVLNFGQIFIEGAQGTDSDSGNGRGSAFRVMSEDLSGTQLSAQSSKEILVRMDPTYELVLAAGGIGNALTDNLIIESDADNQVRLEVPMTGRVNLAPQAVAVEMLSRNSFVKIDLGREVDIDGSDTWEPEGDPFTFRWSLTRAPEESNAVLPESTLALPQTSIIPDFGGNYVVTLRATDVGGAWSEAAVDIYTHDLVIVLTWETDPEAPCQSFSEEACAAMSSQERRTQCCGQSDLDIHLIKPQGTLGDYGDCPVGCVIQETNEDGNPVLVDLCSETTDEHAETCRQTGSDCAYANRYPEWGVIGRADDPKLDVDDIRGEGPEVMTLNTPQAGTYQVVVHYCTDRIGEPTWARIKVYVKGDLQYEAGPVSLDAQGTAWAAAYLVRVGTPEEGSWSFTNAPAPYLTNVPSDLCNR